MKKPVLLALSLAVSLMLTGVATASYMNPQVGPGILTSEYSFNPADYWTFADFTAPNTSMNSEFSLLVEEAAWDSGFGLYAVDDFNNPSSVTKFSIFSPTDEPYMAKTVNVKVKAGTYYLTLDGANDPNANWTAFDYTFGFYFDVQDTGESFYTDKRLNSVDQKVEHISTVYADGFAKALVFLEDQVENPDRDYNDMVVKVTDVTPAPVPEPGTLLLLGSGLLGVGVLRRKKK